MKPKVFVAVGAIFLFCVAAVVTAAFLRTSNAKRKAPPSIKPVVAGGIEYRAPNTYTTEGIVQAWDTNVTKMLWQKKIYFTIHIPLFVEEDAQWNFISSMSAGPSTNEISIANESGGKYVLNILSHRVKKM